MLIPDRAYNAITREVLVRHFDANDAVFLERELTQLRQKLFEVLFAPSIARTLGPKATDIAPSAETYSYKVFKPVGEAGIIAYDSNGLPRVDVVADEVLGKVRPVGASYGWNINELRESARLGLQLSEVKAKTARDAVERGIDELVAFGTIADASGNRQSIGLNGLANSTLVGTPLTGHFWVDGTGTPNPSPLDPDVILGDLNAMVTKVSNQSLNIFKADTLVLPLFHYNYIQQTPWSALTGDSILTVFMRNNPQVTSVIPWHKLNTVSSAQGGAALPRGLAYQKDPMTMELVIPQEFEQMPPEMRVLEFIINCTARCGGAKIYQPQAFVYTDFAVT